MPKFGMAINTKKCFGCNACTVACKVSNGLGPGLFYSYVKIKETGAYPNARMTVQISLCNQCANPSCVKVCPVGASEVREDGIVHIDSSICIGCRYCMVACPYNVRIVMADPNVGYYEEGLTENEKMMYADHQKGTIAKCDFCSGRLEEGLVPACVNTCPGQARIFGDIDDPNSEISQLLSKTDYTVLKPEEGTEPHVFYI